MAKDVFLIVEPSQEGQKSKWRKYGEAYECRDGSLNVKLEIFPGLTFNIRDRKAKSDNNDEAAEEA